MPVLEKAIAKKAGSKGTTSCFSKPPVNSSSSLDTIARVCGFSLGKEEATRLANIYLIQAKEEALTALANAKQKIVLSSSDIRDGSCDESSSEQQAPILELEGARANIDDNLSQLDQG